MTSVELQKRVIAGLLARLNTLKEENALLKAKGRSADELFALIEGSSPVKLRWDLKPAEIMALATATCERVRAAYKAIATSKGNTTYENTIQAMSEVDMFADVIENMATFPAHTSPDKELRDAGTEAEKMFNTLGVECAMNFDVYQAVKAYADKKEPLGPEQQRLVDRLMRDYKRNGLSLEKDERNQVKTLKEEMNSLGVDYQRNLGEENAKFEFSGAELKDTPADFLESRKKEGTDDTYEVTLKYPDYIPIMKYCSVPETRRKMEKEFNSRCIESNTKILERLVELRQQQADVLGYSTHAEYVLETRMATSPKVVVPFLQDLADKLTPLQTREVEACLAFKKEQEGALEGYEHKLCAWDISYYRNKIEERDYQVDQQEIKQFFPIGVVTEGLLDIYQELLSLSFTLLPDAQVWHPDVLMYEVRDAQQGSDKHLVGYFYMDMYPREGKYGHAACFGLQASCKNGSCPGGRQLPVAAMVCNFSKPEPGRPSLLLHSEVETFFHEFGHVMHQLCSLCDEIHFAGTRVERDFVEAPSQMLENWCWEKEALDRLSGHVDDHSRKMPASLVETLLKSRLANCGILNKRQLLLGTFDQTIHSSGATVDTAAVLARITREITGLEMTPGTNMSAAFGHLAGGYDAQYYGYMWSEVYSADMFVSRFKQEGIFSKQAGLDYRNKILARGGSKDAIDLLRDFLGREPSSDAFLKSKGL